MDTEDMKKQKDEQKKREKAVEKANASAREMFRPENIVKTEDSEMRIIIQGGEKNKTVEERTYKNGVKKRRLKKVTKNNKVIFGKK